MEPAWHPEGDKSEAIGDQKACINRGVGNAIEKDTAVIVFPDDFGSNFQTKRTPKSLQQIILKICVYLLENNPKMMAKRGPKWMTIL